MESSQRALCLCHDTKEIIKAAAKEAGVSASVINGLIDEGALETVVIPPDPVALLPDPDFSKPEFSLAQLAAADMLRKTVEQGGYTVTLLDGVTGSGKTEVYFEAIAECLRQGKQALVLLPEIALTEPFLKRFEARFGCQPVAWHSDLRSSQRRRAWRGIASGEAAVAINQRSDACAVPRGSVVMEAMVALVLADAVLEKFGGDSVAETRRNVTGYLDALTWR